jgi:hypothetical protein
MVTPEPQYPEDRTLKRVGNTVLTVIVTTLSFATHGHPLDGFLLGIAASVFSWKTGLFDIAHWY